MSIQLVCYLGGTLDISKENNLRATLKNNAHSLHFHNLFDVKV